MQAVRPGPLDGVLVSQNKISDTISNLTVATGFYLITTDILGPYGSGFAMGTLGWGPGEPNILT